MPLVGIAMMGAMSTRRGRRRREIERGVESGPAATNGRNEAPLEMWARRLAPLTIVALTFLAYSNGVTGAKPMDDASFVGKLGLSRNLGAEIVRFFTTDAWGTFRFRSDIYRPLTLTTIAIQGSQYGADPRPYHAFNIALHIATALVVFGLTRSLLRASPPLGLSESLARAHAWKAAFCAGLVFGVHPIHTEAVDSVLHRAEILATLGVTGGLWILWVLAEKNPWWAWSLASVLYFLALLSKESAATMPLIAILMLWLFGPNRSWRARLRQLAPSLLMLLPLAAYLVLRIPAVRPLPLQGAPIPGQGVVTVSGLGQRLTVVLTMIRESLRMVVWPYPLRVSYDDFVATASWLGVVAAYVVPLILVVSAIALRRRLPGFTFGIAFFYISLLPGTRLLAPTGVLGVPAERYVYLPSTGIIIVFGFVLAALAARFGNELYLVAAVFLVAILTPFTYARNWDWHSDLALWQAEVATAPENPDPWKWLTVALMNVGRYEEADKICSDQLPRHQSFAQLYINCGWVHQHFNRQSDAEAAFRKAAELSDTNSFPHLVYARFLGSAHRTGDSEREFDRAIALEQDEVKKHAIRGEMIASLHPDRLSDARKEYDAALAIDPGYQPARDALLKLDSRSR